MVKSFSAGVSCFQLFSGLSGGPWQARKYSVWRDGCRSLPGFRFYHRRLWSTGSPEHPKLSLRAERSNPSCSKESLDCFVASAPRNDGKSKHSFPLSRRDAPEVCKSFSHLSKREGAGNAGCALHPRSRVQCAQEDAHTSIQVQRRQSDIPCAMALRLIPRSPPRRIRLASVAS